MWAWGRLLGWATGRTGNVSQAASAVGVPCAPHVAYTPRCARDDVRRIAFVDALTVVLIQP